MEADDVDVARMMGAELIGSHHPDASKVRQRLAAHPEGLIVLRVGQRYVAHSLHYLLSTEGVGAITTKAVTTGSQLADVHLAGPSEAAGVYVAAVAALAGHETRAVRLAVSHLGRTLTSSPYVEWLFARAASQRGMTLMTRLGFAPLGAPSEIAMRSIPQRLTTVDWPFATRAQVVAIARAMRPEARSDNRPAPPTVEG